MLYTLYRQAYMTIYDIQTPGKYSSCHFYFYPNLLMWVCVLFSLLFQYDSPPRLVLPTVQEFLHSICGMRGWCGILMVSYWMEWFQEAYGIRVARGHKCLRLRECGQDWWIWQICRGQNDRGRWVKRGCISSCDLSRRNLLHRSVFRQAGL